MELTTEHLDLLRVVEELETPDAAPGTRAAGQRLLELWQERGGAYSWHPSAPWHGTNPWASELRDQKLLEVQVGMASVRRWDQDAETADQYGLSLTDAGRQVLRRRPGRMTLSGSEFRWRSSPARPVTSH